MPTNPQQDLFLPNCPQIRFNSRKTWHTWNAASKGSILISAILHKLRGIMNLARAKSKVFSLHITAQSATKLGNMFCYYLIFIKNGVTHFLTKKEFETFRENSPPDPLRLSKFLDFHNPNTTTTQLKSWV